MGCLVDAFGSQPLDFFGALRCAAWQLSYVTLLLALSTVLQTPTARTGSARCISAVLGPFLTIQPAT